VSDRFYDTDPVYYRVYLNHENLICVVHMQYHDERDYKDHRFARKPDGERWTFGTELEAKEFVNRTFKREAIHPDDLLPSHPSFLIVGDESSVARPRLIGYARRHPPPRPASRKAPAGFSFCVDRYPAMGYSFLVADLDARGRPMPTPEMPTISDLQGRRRPDRLGPLPRRRKTVYKQAQSPTTATICRKCGDLATLVATATPRRVTATAGGSRRSAEEVSSDSFVRCPKCRAHLEPARRPRGTSGWTRRPR
jgi:hypothetical protein